MNKWDLFKTVCKGVATIGGSLCSLSLVFGSPLLIAGMITALIAAPAIAAVSVGCVTVYESIKKPSDSSFSHHDSSKSFEATQNPVLIQKDDHVINQKQTKSTSKWVERIKSIPNKIAETIWR